MKTCVKCSCENENEALFCKECGEAFSAEAAASCKSRGITTDKDGFSEIGGFRFRPVPDEEIRALLDRKTSPAVKIAASLILLLLITGLTLMVTMVRGSQRPDQMDIIAGEDKAYFLLNGERIDGSVKGSKLDYDICDSESAAYVLDTEKNKLYAVSGEGIVKVSNDVTAAKISSNGKFILYTDEENKAYIYSIRKEKSEKICSDMYIETAVFSPDGESIAFNKKNSDTLFLYDGKDCEKIDDELVCIGLSDNAKYLYAAEYKAMPSLPEDLEKPRPSDYEDYDDYKAAYEDYSKVFEEYEEKLAEYEAASPSDTAIYLLPKADPDKSILIDKNADCTYIRFNSDLSQIVYHDSEGRTYFSKKGGDSERISKNSLFISVNSKDSRYYHVENNAQSFTVLPYESLLNRVYCNKESGDIYFVDKKLECEKTADTAVSITVTVSDNERYMYYIDNEDRLYYTDTKTGDERKRLLKDVSSFIPDKNFRGVYAICTDGDLYYVANDGNKERIDKDIDMIVKAPDGGIYYIDEDNKLYYAENDKKSDRISKDAAVVIGGERAALYAKSQDDDTYDIYTSADGKDFEIVCRNVTAEGLLLMIKEYYNR